MSKPLLTMTFRVGTRFKVTCTMPSDARLGMAFSSCFEWDPEIPTKLWPHEIADYRRGRDAYSAELARILGGKVIIAETGTGEVTMIDPATTSEGPPQ